jgi:type 1 fimbria pilin
MKKNIVGMAGVFLAMAVVNAQAADLRVKGTIAPASCSFTLTNAVIDYGRIDPNSLSATNYTKLGAKSTPYAIKCGSHVKTKVGIKAVDNRASTKIPNLMVSQFGPNYTDRYQYGLGNTAKAQKIGGYVLHLRNSVADGRAVRVMGSNNNGGVWVPTSTEAVGNAATDLTSWHTGNFVPFPMNTVSGNLEVHAVINKTSELDLNSQINLDGQATLELRYL